MRSSFTIYLRWTLFLSSHRTVQYLYEQYVIEFSLLAIHSPDKFTYRWVAR